MTLGSHQRSIGKSQVHFTPRWILDRLGIFDTDPCAGQPRPWDCARCNYTEGGLDRCWYGRVWLNPPFDRREIGRWIAKLAEHGRGTALVHARTETDWFANVWRSATTLLFLGERIVFCKADGSPQTISDPSSLHFGKPANSGAPVVIAAFGREDAIILENSGLRGIMVERWHAVGASSATAKFGSDLRRTGT